jgi:hypothetical protein
MAWHAICKAKNQRKGAKKMQTPNAASQIEAKQVYRCTTKAPYGTWVSFFMAPNADAAANAARFYWDLPSTFPVSAEVAKPSE